MRGELSSVTPLSWRQIQDKVTTSALFWKIKRHSCGLIHNNILLIWSLTWLPHLHLYTSSWRRLYPLCHSYRNMPCNHCHPCHPCRWSRQLAWSPTTLWLPFCPGLLGPNTTVPTWTAPCCLRGKEVLLCRGISLATQRAHHTTGSVHTVHNRLIVCVYRNLFLSLGSALTSSLVKQCSRCCASHEWPSCGSLFKVCEVLQCCLVSKVWSVLIHSKMGMRSEMETVNAGEILRNQLTERKKV